MSDSPMSRLPWTSPGVEPLTGPDGTTEDAHAATRNGLNDSLQDR